MALIDDTAAVIRINRPWGFVELTNNEVTVTSLVDDPPGFRLHSKSDGLGKVSFSKIGADGRVDEHVLVQGKKDERTRGRDDVPYGELTVHIKGPKRDANDDGMVPVFQANHDYVWIKGINGNRPTPPAITLPPAPPVEEWTSPANHMKHLREIDRIEQEMGIPMDSGRMNAYLTGRNKNLAEVHDDELRRAGQFRTDPCGGVNRNPLA